MTRRRDVLWLSRAAAVLSLPSTGCFTVSTASVDVRTPSEVALATPDGQPLLPASAAPERSTVVRGDYWEWLSRRPYEIVAAREPGGAIDLQCDACAKTTMPFASGETEVALLDEAGHARETPSWLVDLDGETRVLRVGYDVCMRRNESGPGCDAPARTSLIVPTGDVLVVRRRVEPVRIWGAMLLAASAGFLTMSAVAMASDAAGSTAAQRLPWAIGFAIPGALLASVGGWEAFSAARVETWSPP